MRKAISYLLQPKQQPPPVLPITAVDRRHMMQTLKKYILGVPALTISAGAVFSLKFSVKFLGTNVQYCSITGFMTAIAFILVGISLGRIYLQGLGIFLCVLFLFVLVASDLPIAYACVVWICGAVCLYAILYTVIKYRHAD